MESGQNNQISVYQLLAEVDEKWATLDKSFQSSPHFAGRVKLKSPDELEREKGKSDDVSFLQCVTFFMVCSHGN